jgi:hypothetical protein
MINSSAAKEKTHKVTMHNNLWATCFLGSEKECNQWIKEHPFESYQFMVLPNVPKVNTEA